MGDVFLSSGTTLTVLVGGQGAYSPFLPYEIFGSGGGGGSFVWTGTGTTPSASTLLVAAGGGGGAYVVIRRLNPDWPQMPEAMRYPEAPEGLPAGVDTAPTAAACTTTITMAAAAAPASTAREPTRLAFLAWPGSAPRTSGSYGDGVLPGGFGGGGGGGNEGGGGGGGYSGGGGGFKSGGGGGGSYLAASFADRVLTSGVRTGNGYVTIDLVSPAVPEPATWAMMLAGFAGLGFVGRSRKRRIRRA